MVSTSYYNISHHDALEFRIRHARTGSYRESDGTRSRSRRMRIIVCEAGTGTRNDRRAGPLPHQCLNEKWSTLQAEAKRGANKDNRKSPGRSTDQET